MINELTQQTFNENVSTHPVCMVDFYSTSCGPCRALLPTLEKLTAEFPISKVNVYESPDLANEAKISAVPTLIFYKDGKEAKRLKGVQTEQALREAFDSLK